MHFHQKKKKIHCFLMHRKIFEKKEKRERIDIHVDRTSGITRFPGTNMMGWIQRLQRNPNRPPNHYTIKKKKHFSLIYFPPPFTFIAVKLVSTFFFFFSLSPVSKHPVQRQNLFHSDESNRFFSINTRINT